MSELVEHFATSHERLTLLRGLLSYRQALNSLGMADGHQWIGGSFVENVEVTRRRAPVDIDVVTFTTVPGVDKVTKQMLARGNPKVFFPDEAKKSFNCDAYFVDLAIAPLLIVDATRYWFGLFSHQRHTNLWKGMLQVPLISDDQAALRLLDVKELSFVEARNA